MRVPGAGNIELERRQRVLVERVKAEISQGARFTLAPGGVFRLVAGEILHVLKEFCVPIAGNFQRTAI